MNRNYYSVLMSVYDGDYPEFLKQSMESIFVQTAPTDDFVLVCDGQLTDDLNRVLNDYSNSYKSLHIVRMSENKGLAEALNFGLGFCKHEIVARMDSDDIAMPHRIERQLAKLDGVAVLGSAVLEFHHSVNDAKTLRITPSENSEIHKFAKRRNPFNHPSVMFRKSAVLEVGGYEKFMLCEDYQLWIKILMSGGKGKNIPEPLLYMRVGSGLYERRGGYSYFKTMHSFRRWLRQINFITSIDYFVLVLAHAISCVVPTGLRGILYGRFLRNVKVE